MPFTIAIAGKGGTGKTTVAALLVSRLVARGATPVLAVDADPNACLDTALGVEVTMTVGAVREEARELAGKGLGAGVTKQELLELKIAQSLVEAEAFDLIAMGRCEGPGCYCYANNVLKQVIERLANDYQAIVIDNEAGLENLSRRIVRRVDLLVMITDPSRSGLRTVDRLHGLAHEMDLAYDSLAIIVNRLRDDHLPDQAEALGERTNADLVIGLPADLELAELGEQGASLLGLADSHLLARRLDQALDQVGPKSLLKTIGAAHHGKT
jgi:CO dehydrogenase maturation factor